jgi:hypothetical protein
MEIEALRARRAERRRQIRRRRLGAVVVVGALAAAIALIVVVASSSGGGSHAVDAARSSGGAARHATARVSAPVSVRTGPPGTQAVPILMYHVIAAPPAGAPFPGLYVEPAEFAEQMHALASAGWHAVTLDQVEEYWRQGVPLGTRKPVVISFDNGYCRHRKAVSALRRSGGCWPRAGSSTLRASATQT